MKKLLLTGAFTIVSAFAFQCLAWTGSNWMSELPDDAYVAQVSIPGTHDSATGNGTTMDSFARTQEISPTITVSTTPTAVTARWLSYSATSQTVPM